MFDEDYLGNSRLAREAELLDLYYDDLLTVGSDAYQEVMDLFKEIHDAEIEELPF